MTKLENKALKIVKANHGISFKNLTKLLSKDLSSVKKCIKTLNVLGLVSHWHGGLYPNYRSLVIYEKGKSDEVGEIVLVNHLTPKQLNKYIEPAEDGLDKWYCTNYGIDDNNKVL